MGPRHGFYAHVNRKVDGQLPLRNNVNERHIGEFVRKTWTEFIADALDLKRPAVHEPSPVRKQHARSLEQAETVLDAEILSSYLCRRSSAMVPAELPVHDPQISWLLNTKAFMELRRPFRRPQTGFEIPSAKMDTSESIFDRRTKFCTSRYESIERFSHSLGIGPEEIRINDTERCLEPVRILRV